MDERKFIPPEEITKKYIKNLVENYDSLVRNLIPDYEGIQQRVVDAIPFDVESSFTALDLGTGTGETAKGVLQRFPNSRVVSVDLMPEMIGAAREKLSDFSSRTEFLTGDFSRIELPEQVDAVVSALAIHHLASDQKKDFYRKIFKNLNPGGVISIGDLIKFRNHQRDAVAEEQWRQFLYTNLGSEQGQYRFDEHKKGDIPSPIEDQIEWLSEAGFADPKISWDYMNYANFEARKIKA